MFLNFKTTFTLPNYSFAHLDICNQVPFDACQISILIFSVPQILFIIIIITIIIFYSFHLVNINL